MLTVSNSELGTYRRCERRWYLSYQEGWTTKQVEAPLEFGQFFHDLMELLYTHPGPQDEARIAVMRKLGEMEFANALNDTVEWDRLRNMMRNYFAWQDDTGADHALTPYQVEQSVSMPLPSGHRLRGKTDLIMMDEEIDQLVLIDHKSAKDFRIVDLLGLNPQSSLYAALLRHNGMPVVGAIYNIVRKIKDNSRAKPPFVKRERVWFADESLDLVVANADRTATDMARTIERAEGSVLRTVPTYDMSCGWCPFRDVCEAINHGEDEEIILLVGFEQNDPNARYDTDEQASPKGDV